MAGWRAQPHVRRWWGEPTVEPESEKIDDPHIALWIVELAGRPFALIQDYEIQDWPPHHFDHLPPGSRGHDLFIGEPDLLGLGHGPRFLRQHIDRMFADGVPAAGIDPHPDNRPAIRAFERAGFTITGGPIETLWGRAMLLERYKTPARDASLRKSPHCGAKRLGHQASAC